MVVSRLNTAKNNTINPAVLKNTPEFFDCENLTEVKDISDSTGSVPREKTSIIKAPESQFPVVIAANKIDLKKANVKSIEAAFPQYPVIGISAEEGTNMEELYESIVKMVK